MGQRESEIMWPWRLTSHPRMLLAAGEGGTEWSLTEFWAPRTTRRTYWTKATAHSSPSRRRWRRPQLVEWRSSWKRCTSLPWFTHSVHPSIGWLLIIIIFHCTICSSHAIISLRTVVAPSEMMPMSLSQPL